MKKYELLQQCKEIGIKLELNASVQKIRTNFYY